MESLRAAVTTDQLPAVLTHGTLIVVAVTLQRKHEGRCIAEANQEGDGEQIDYRVCICLPLVVKRLSSRGNGAFRLVQPVARIKHIADFDAPPGTSCHVKKWSSHKMLDCF